MVIFAILHYRVTKKISVTVPYIAENIDEETANTRSALKGDTLAKIKVILYNLENLSIHQSNFIYVLISNLQNDYDIETCLKLLKTPSCFDPITNFLERYEKHNHFQCILDK